MMRIKLKSQLGMTLIEVMIALIITGVITTSIFKLYITQHQNYITQEDITDIQQNARSSIDEISRHIRMAGYELPLGLNAIEAYNTNPDTIVLMYHNSGCDTYLSSAMTNGASILNCATDVSCFFDGQWVFIYDADSAEGEWFDISSVQTGTMQLAHSSTSLSRKYDANALVFALSQVKFFIDNTTDPDHPKLMIQVMGDTPKVYAENITDLQFQYIMKNGTTLNEPTVAENIREVQIELSGRSNMPEVDDEGTEHFRDRTFSTSVFLRNVGI